MSDEQVNFNNKDIYAKGRNGRMKCVGIDLFDNLGVLEISPINSRGIIGNCFIQLPMDKLDELIQALQKFK